MASTARVHLLQIELSGPKIILHGTCVREIEDGADKVSAGTCDVEVELTAAEVNLLLDKVKSEMVRRAASPKASASEKQFKDIPIQ